MVRLCVLESLILAVFVTGCSLPPISDPICTAGLPECWGAASDIHAMQSLDHCSRAALGGKLGLETIRSDL